MIQNTMTTEERELQLDKERAYASGESAKIRAHNLEMAKIQASIKPDPWPVLKSAAYAPCYFIGLCAVTILALCRRQIPAVLVDFLNS